LFRAKTGAPQGPAATSNSPEARKAAHALPAFLLLPSDGLFLPSDKPGQGKRRQHPLSRQTNLRDKSYKNGDSGHRVRLA
jgi:hypothetical protein